jgi:hypothetical protein
MAKRQEIDVQAILDGAPFEIVIIDHTKYGFFRKQQQKKRPATQSTPKRPRRRRPRPEEIQNSPTE